LPERWGAKGPWHKEQKSPFWKAPLFNNLIDRWWGAQNPGPPAPPPPPLEGPPLTIKNLGPAGFGPGGAKKNSFFFFQGGRSAEWGVEFLFFAHKSVYFRFFELPFCCSGKKPRGPPRVWGDGKKKSVGGECLFFPAPYVSGAPNKRQPGGLKFLPGVCEFCGQNLDFTIVAQCF